MRRHIAKHHSQHRDHFEIIGCIRCAEKIDHDDCIYGCTIQSSSRKNKDYSEKKGKYKCSDCDTRFSRKEHLKVHIESVHEDMCHKCSICKSVFLHVNSLKAHISRVHEEKELTENDPSTHRLRSEHWTLETI